MTISPYLSPKTPMAPRSRACSMGISSQTTGMAALMASLTYCSTAFSSSGVHFLSRLKSNLSLSAVMLDPFCWMSGLTIFLSAAFSRWVAVCSLVVSTAWSARPPLNCWSAPILEFSWWALNLSWKSLRSTFLPCSAASSWVSSTGNPKVS